MPRLSLEGMKDLGYVHHLYLDAKKERLESVLERYAYLLRKSYLW